MNKEYIVLKDLGNLQKRQPDIFPVFGKVRKVNGELIGEVIGYSDAYGRPIELERNVAEFHS